jgi:hypothetical protein
MSVSKLAGLLLLTNASPTMQHNEQQTPPLIEKIMNKQHVLRK